MRIKWSSSQIFKWLNNLPKISEFSLKRNIGAILDGIHFATNFTRLSLTMSTLTLRIIKIHNA